MSDIGGVSRGANFNAGGPGSVPPSVAKHLGSPEMNHMIGSLGLRKENITQVKEHFGVKGNLHLNEAQFIQLTPSADEAMKLMGVNHPEVAIVVGAENEFKLIRKRLKEIKESTLNNEELGYMVRLLGLDKNTLVFEDHHGGVLIIQAFIREIEAQLAKDEDDEES